MTKQELSEILRKRAEKEYPIDPITWGLIPSSNDLALMKRNAYLAGANDALEISNERISKLEQMIQFLLDDPECELYRSQAREAIK